MSDRNQNRQPRIFKIGATRVTEDPSMSNLANDEVRAFLQRTYPEVANAVIREREENDVRVVDFIAQPGRKG